MLIKSACQPVFLTEAEISSYIRDLTKKQKKVFSYFHNNRYLPYIHMSHAHIAKKIGCSTKTVQRATNKFKESGLMTWTETTKVRRCGNIKTWHEYFLSPIMHSKTVFNSIVKMFYFSIALLMSNAGAKRGDSKNVQLIKNIYINKLASYSLLKKDDEIVPIPEEKVQQFKTLMGPIKKDSKNIYEKREEVMNEVDTSKEKMEAIEQFNKIIKLEPHGIMRFMIFPVDIINKLAPVLANALRIHKTQEEVIGYTIGTGVNMCKREGLKIDYQEYYNLRDNLGMNHEDKNFIDANQFNNRVIVSYPVKKYNKPEEQVPLKTKAWEPPPYKELTPEEIAERKHILLTLKIPSFMECLRDKLLSFTD